MKRIDVTLCERNVAAPANCAGRRNQPASPRLICILSDVGKNVMKARSGLGRNDVIKAVALAGIVVFPLLAYPQLGRTSAAVTPSQDASPVAGAAVTTAAAIGDSCADQNWPFFSAGCLRGSTQTIEPRLVSMNGETSPTSAATGDDPKPAPTAGIVRNNGPSAASKRTAKPRIATQRRERRAPNVNYAVNLQASYMPGW
jgi:hypothetical protein